MTKILFLATAGAVLSLTGTSAVAQQQQPAKPVSRADFVKNLDTRFSAMDTNHDGKVSRDEVAAQMQRDLQQANAKISGALRDKFKQLDTNHDGQLSLAEFMAAQPALHPNQTADQLMQQFDANHDGKISADEFRAPDLAKFNRIDVNHDGVVTPAEMQAAAGRK